MFVDLQETSGLFRDMNYVLSGETSERRTKLISLSAECGVVELVQKIWRRCEIGKLLKQNKDLPPHAETTIKVRYNITETLLVDQTDAILSAVLVSIFLRILLQYFLLQGS